MPQLSTIPEHQVLGAPSAARDRRSVERRSAAKSPAEKFRLMQCLDELVCAVKEVIQDGPSTKPSNIMFDMRPVSARRRGSTIR
jgi:hypothetical protein